MLPSIIQTEAERRRCEAGVQPFVWPFVWASVEVPLPGLDEWTAGVRRGLGTRGRPASIHTRSGPVHQFHVRAARGDEPSGPVLDRRPDGRTPVWINHYGRAGEQRRMKEMARGGNETNEWMGGVVTPQTRGGEYRWTKGPMGRILRSQPGARHGDK